MAALTRIKTDNILDQEVREQDLADGAVTFDKILITGGVAAGEVLKTDGSGGLFWELATGSSASLDTLTDVDTTSKLAGDSLVYDLGTDTWRPGSNVPSSLGLNSLIDVTLTPLNQNEFLKFDGAKWVNDQVSIIHIEGRADVAVTGLLNSLVDVNVAGATTDQRLAIDSAGVWRAVDAAELSTIDAFADVDTTGKFDGNALVFDGNTLTWGAVDIGGLGASSRTTIVQNIAALLAQGLKLGDQTYVQDGATTSEWEMFLLHTLPGSDITEWSKIATLDSAATDARTIETFVNFNDSNPQLLGNISDGSRVTTITINVITIFDGADPAPKLSIGDDGDNGRIIGDDPLKDYLSEPDFDLKVVGTYTLNVDYVYDGTETPGTDDTDINAYFDFAGATQGQARVLVTYV